NNEYLIVNDPNYDPAPLYPNYGYCRLYQAPAEQNAQEMCSFTLEMCWNRYRAQAVTVTGADLLEQWHWPDLYFEIDNNIGKITITGAHSECSGIENITDPQELLFVGFLISGSPGQDIGLQITHFEYNEVDPLFTYWYNNTVPGRPDARTVGALEVCEFLCVSGEIQYCSNEKPVCGANVTLTYVPDSAVYPPPDIHDTTVQTQCDAECQEDCRGHYLICDIVGGYDYCLSAWKDDEYDNAITAFDASLILRYLVNQLYFDCCQKVAADVTGNGCIAAYDASHILKYLVGSLPDQPYFPKKAAEQTNWVFFTPEDVDPPGCPADDDCLIPVETICLDNLYRNFYDGYFWAVILGDVSGNWGISQGGKLIAQDIKDVCRVSVVSSDDQQTVYEISGDFGEAYAFQFDLSSAATVELAGEHSGWVYQTNTSGDRLLVAAAGATPSGKNMPLRIKVDNDVEQVSLDNMVVNETPIPGSLVLKGATLPGEYQLANNYPNPFNPETQISFSLPTATEVNLSVYNILGQHVVTLASGAFEAGTHQVMWDGTDESGDKVTSGIYLYRLETPEYLETKKMVLLK
ncbi:MAG: FlgD immunoglobulin-like domain containing protein, partial [Candidatus Zixiibacteriota bacterium]